MTEQENKGPHKSEDLLDFTQEETLIPTDWKPFEYFNEPNFASYTAEVYQQKGEQVAIKQETSKFGGTYYWLYTHSSHLQELKQINTLLRNTSLYSNLSTNYLFKNQPDQEKLPSAETQKEMLVQAYDEIIQTVGGRDYFKSENGNIENHPVMYEIEFAGSHHPDILIVEQLVQRGYDIKLFQFPKAFRDSAYVLAKGEALEAYSKVRNTPEARLMRLYYRRPVWASEEDNPNNKYSADNTKKHLHAQTSYTENDFSVFNTLYEGDRKKEVEEGDHETASLFIGNIIEREEGRPLRDENEPLNHVKYSQTDFETGLVHKRIRKIKQEIVEMYGLDEYFLPDEPYLEFVNLEEYYKRWWGVSIDYNFITANLPAATSYFSMKGEEYFHQPEDRPVISIFEHNTGDQTLIEEVLHWLHSSYAGVEYQEHEDLTKSAFFHAVVSEGLAYLTTLNLLPVRDEITLETKVNGFGENFTQKDLQELVVTAGVNLEDEILRMGKATNYDEWFINHHFSKMVGDFPTGITHGIGYFLGRKVKERLQSGEILPSQLRNIFFREGDPAEQYKKLAKLTLE